MLSLLYTAFIGLVVGVIAKWLMPGRDPGGFIITIIIGIAGAYLARFVGTSLFDWYRDGSAPGWIASILGAMLLLWIYRMFQKRAG